MGENPYLLPAGNVQIAFSGGRTSAYMLHQILDANGGLPDRVEVLFQNTGQEMPQTLDFIQEVGMRWGVKIKWLEYRPSSKIVNPFDDPSFAEAYSEVFDRARLDRMRMWWEAEATDMMFAQVAHNSASRDGEPFEVLILRRRFLPNQRSRFCTQELKVRTAKRYLRSIGWDHWTSCTGIRADEPSRLNKRPPKDRWTVWNPLADAGVSKTDVSAFWAVMPFDLALPNVKGRCWLGNCGGCFLKSEAHVAAFTREYPDAAWWWEGWEVLASYLSNARGMTPGRGAWWSKRYTRRELREFIDRQGAWAFDVDGLFCQANDGECTG